MNKYVKVKRVLAAILTVIIMLGVCDWSTLIVLADLTAGGDDENTIIDNIDLSFNIKSYKSGGVDGDFDNEELFDHLFDIPDDCVMSSVSDYVDSFMDDFTATKCLSNGAVTIDWRKGIRDNGASKGDMMQYSDPGKNENLLLVYVQSYLNRSGNDSIKGITVCTYDTINGKFYYLTMGGTAIYGSDDKMFFELGSRDHLFILDCYGDWDDNIEYNIGGICNYIDRVTGSEQLFNSVLSYYVNGTNMDSESANIVKFLNNLYGVTEGTYTGENKLSSKTIILDFSIYGSEVTSYFYSDGAIKFSGASVYNLNSGNKEIIPGYKSEVVLSSDFVDWGDSTLSLTGNVDSNNATGYALVINSINASAKWLHDINEDNLDNFKSNMDKYPNDVIPRILSTYYDVLGQFVESYNLDDQYQAFLEDMSEEGIDFVADCNNDNANLVMRLMHLNVGAMNGENTFGGNIKVSNYSGEDVAVILNKELGTGGTTNRDALIENAIAMGNADIKKIYTIDEIFNTIDSGWKKDYVVSTYRNYVGYYGLSSNENYSIVMASKSLTASYSTDNISSLRDYASLGDKIKADVDNADATINTGSILNVAINADVIAKYIVGSSLFTSDQDDEHDILNIYNATLADLTSMSYSYDSTSTWYPDSIPNNMTLFGDGLVARDILYYIGESSNSDWERLVTHLYRVSLAFEICNNSEHGETEGYTVDQLKAAFDKTFDPSGTLGIGYDLSAVDLSSDNFNNDQVSINMLKAIASADKLYTFLGMDSLSESVDAYVDFWRNFLTEEQRAAILSNPKIKPSITGSTEPFAEKEPLAQFFNIEQKKMSDYWNIGFALSATYVPMETNVYDSTTYTFTDNSVWLYDMVYRFGFYRKALYISNDNNAVTNQLMNSSSSSTRVATLSDLINYDRDIILYVDPNFYNANEVSDIISKLDYTAIRNTSESGQTGGDLWSSLKNSMQELFDLDAASVLKTGGNSYYSNSLYSKCSRLGATTETWSERYADLYLLDDEAITDALTVQDEYTVQQSYAVVSAIYRCEQLYNLMLQSLNSDNAVFKSSKSVCANPTATQQDWLSVYNYYMLANLESQMKNDAASSLDLNAPIFIDVFGNILTESGLVIIPAASNPTLVGEHWDPYTVAFPTYYYNGNMLQPGEFTDEFYEWLTGTDYDANTGKFEVVDSEKIRKECGGGYFALDSDGFTIRAGVIESYDISALVNFEQLQKNAKNIKQLFYNIAYYNKTEDIYKKKGRVLTNMIVEVLRGAPIERIDYTYEGLDGNASIGKYGVYAAYKLEELTKSFLGSGGTSGNSMVTMPNLAFMDGIEYIVLYLFKIMFAVFIVGLVVSLYMDAVQNKLGIMSVGRFLFTCIALLVSLTLLPDLISWSYYKANKELLKDEVGYVMMLNYAKDFDGAEIGITSVTTPETSTELYLKLDDVSLDWWSVIYSVLFTNTYKTVNDLYQSQLEDNLMAQQEDVILKSDGLYIDVRNIFNSTTLQYQPSTKTFVNYNYNGDSNVTSFVVPYYVILDQLIGDINVYNNAQMIDSYSYSIGSNGHICTYGLIAPYFSSASFLEEGYDILGLHYIHQDMGDISGAVTNSIVFDDDDISRMKLSEWYSHYTGSITNSKIDSLYIYARDWIANNRSMMGKVPDEVFLKVFALEMAIEYNNIFGIPDGKSVEIMNIDTRDIMRFMVGDKANAYKYYSYSFSRYVYEEAGTLGVIVAGIFCAILWITSLVKPLCMILILGLFVINILGRKLLFRKESKCFEGYLIGCACLCLCNYAYAGMLKISITVADYGLGAVASLGIGIVVQIVYVFLLVWITSIEMKDWKNNGFYEYANKGSIFVSHMNHTGSLVTNRLIGRGNPAYANRGRHSINRRSLNATGNEMIQQMHERDNVREERALNNSDFDINEEMAGI